MMFSARRRAERSGGRRLLAISAGNVITLGCRCCRAARRVDDGGAGGGNMRSRLWAAERMSRNFSYRNGTAMTDSGLNYASSALRSAAGSGRTEGLLIAVHCGRKNIRASASGPEPNCAMPTGAGGVDFGLAPPCSTGHRGYKLPEDER